MYCDRRGVIGFRHEVPNGRIPLAYGERRILKEAASAMSRHAHNGKLLVTGVPEAGNDDGKAVEACHLFSAQMAELYGLDVPLIDGKRPSLPHAYRARLKRHQQMDARRQAKLGIAAA